MNELYEHENKRVLYITTQLLYLCSHKLWDWKNCTEEILSCSLCYSVPGKMISLGRRSVWIWKAAVVVFSPRRGGSLFPWRGQLFFLEEWVGHFSFSSSKGVGSLLSSKGEGHFFPERRGGGLKGGSLCPPRFVLLTLSYSRCPPHVVLLTLSSSRCPPHVVLLTLSSSWCPPHIVLLTLSSSRCPPHFVLRLSIFSQNFNTFVITWQKNFETETPHRQHSVHEGTIGDEFFERPRSHFHPICLSLFSFIFCKPKKIFETEPVNTDDSSESMS